jgi:hypothetical protein
MHVEGQQRTLGRRVGLHCEWDGDRNSEIVLLVIHIDPVTEISPLSALADNHDARIVVNGIEANVGPPDVLANNVGYGHEGVMEESPLVEMRRQFDVNVCGAVAVMKSARSRTTTLCSTQLEKDVKRKAVGNSGIP